MKSDIDKLPEKIIKEGKSNLKYGPMIRIGMAINKPKNSGNNSNENGINILKFSSNVREFVIQEIPLK